ncbi:MAG: DUF1476 domain-containing protein [Rhodospirillales bacterium]
MGESISDTLHERDKSQEAKFKMDQELRFKAESRRNKLLGIWAAERMGMTSEETDEFAKEVVIADLEGPGVGAVIGRILKEFEKRNVEMTENAIAGKLESLYLVAEKQIAAEFPGALGPDHEKVGG